MSQHTEFTEEQKQYLEGFVAGIARRRGIGVPALSASTDRNAQSSGSLPSGSLPDVQAAATDCHALAQDRVIHAGGALVPEELAKREKHPFDMWDEIAANAASGRFPKGPEIFRHKFHGLFHVAPNQDSFMLRLRLPGGILTAGKAVGLADIAERFGAGTVDITTRANLQIRGIGAAYPIEVLTALQELGLTSRGAGADNIRNITGSPLAGIDPRELIDTRSLCRTLHHLILNHRELYGLPRKFNIAFDGGGQIGVLEDTNDIGFAAVRVGPGKPAAEGVYFRMLLGGITGHGSFAEDAGVLLRPDETVAAAVAIVRLFIAEGDRTDRKRARLRYVIERMGLAETVAAASAHLTFPWRFAPADIAEPRGPIGRDLHVGVHPQARPGLSYIGIVAPAARLDANQLHALASLAARRGSGTMRLTVWQNLLISDIPDAEAADAVAEIEALGLAVFPSAIRTGLVACTGSAGCKFALSDTKRDALALAGHLEPRVALDTPLNIHLTGCPNSCAQHYIGDIGLVATKVDAGDDEVEGYHLVVGGGSAAERGLARALFQSIPAAELPQRIETLLRGYLSARHDGETFNAFANRHSVAELAAMCGSEAR
ncbi:MAG: NirA family protein [Stellaceae bacterium]